MASVTHISNLAARDACDAIVDALDGGTIKIYTGTIAADVDTAVGAQVLLGTLTLATPAFGSAADANPGGQAVAGTITADLVADATGTATWFRVLTSAAVARIDGNVGTVDEAMILNTVAIVAGATLSITSYTFTVPES